MVQCSKASLLFHVLRPLLQLEHQFAADVRFQCSAPSSGVDHRKCVDNVRLMVELAD